jgi:hypothetical protein
VIHKELRYRGKTLVAYPGADVCKAVGGRAAALINDLYRRIEQDELPREAFPHFNSGERGDGLLHAVVRRQP